MGWAQAVRAVGFAAVTVMVVGPAIFCFAVGFVYVICFMLKCFGDFVKWYLKTFPTVVRGAFHDPWGFVEVCGRVVGGILSFWILISAIVA